MVNLSVCSTALRHDTWQLGGIVHAVITWASGGAEWSALRSGLLTPVSHRIGGLEGVRFGLDAVAKMKIPTFVRYLILTIRLCSSVTTLTRYPGFLNPHKTACSECLKLQKMIQFNAP
jgi:hypothetical protein